MIHFPDAPEIGEAFGPFVWDGVKWTTPVESGGGGGIASDALPLMAGVAVPVAVCVWLLPRRMGSEAAREREARE